MLDLSESLDNPEEPRHLAVSIGMCTYNGGRHLPAQLQSIAAQQVMPCELVICDDGSSDETASIVRKFADSVKFPVRFVENCRRLGPTKNFEHVVTKCRGDIIVLSDQDDIWMPNKLAVIISAFEAEPAASYVFSDAETIDEDGREQGRRLWSFFGSSRDFADFRGIRQLETLLQQNVVTGATMAFRSSLRTKLLPIPSSWMHDHWIALLGSSVSYGIPIPEPLIKYRRHSSQACGVGTKSFWEACRASLESNDRSIQDRCDAFEKVWVRILSFRDEPVTGGTAEILQAKREHLQRRLRARRERGLARVGRILAEATTGRYHKFSEGTLSIARDMLP